MTTAGRPTFDPARGGSQRGEKSLGALSKQYSSRDLPAHTKLKYRQPGQGTTSDNKLRDFRRELEEKERAIRSSDKSSKRPSVASSSRSTPRPLPVTGVSDTSQDRDSDLESSGSSSDSEDETAELLAELNRIKKERAAEEAKREAEKREAEEKIRMENIMSGNPLIGGTSSSFRVKRRWDEDVVFKNCARGDEGGKEVTFINDTLRSEFHKKFMDKYIK